MSHQLQNYQLSRVEAWLKNAKNLSTCAVTCNNRSSVLKSSQFIICLNPDFSLIVSSPWTEFLSLVFISTKQFSGMGSSGSLSRNCSSQSHSGPSRQSAFTDSSSGAEPLDGMSAGLSCPEGCLQQLGVLSFWLWQLDSVQRVSIPYWYLVSWRVQPWNLWSNQL